MRYEHLVKSIRTALLSAGINPANFAGHSFRRGAASQAAAAGCADHEIQLLGRWRSDAYKLYIDMDIRRLLHVSKLLHMGHPPTAPPAPPAL
jgi:hypothetical protein